MLVYATRRKFTVNTCNVAFSGRDSGGGSFRLTYYDRKRDCSADYYLKGGAPALQCYNVVNYFQQCCGSDCFDADPDPNFHVDPDWHQNDADPHADPTGSFARVGKKGEKITFMHSNTSLHCISFLISGKCVMVFQVF
jgi:hypothetical protein